jgi:hypothetical protein
MEIYMCTPSHASSDEPIFNPQQTTAMLNIRDELVGHGLSVGFAMYEKCPYGSGVYPLGEDLVVKAELVGDFGHQERMQKEGTTMAWMAHHAVGLTMINTGSIAVDVDGEQQTILYMVMEKYMVDLGTLSVISKKMPSNPFDCTTGWLINKLFKHTAYEARMLLTDLKPPNIVANLDVIIPQQGNDPRVRVASVALIDFGPEYCLSLPPDIPSRTVHLTMLLLYSSISLALGYPECAEIVSPFIRRFPRQYLQETVTWMDTQSVVQRAVQQYKAVIHVQNFE